MDKQIRRRDRRRSAKRHRPWSDAPRVEALSTAALLREQIALTVAEAVTPFTELRFAELAGLNLVHPIVVQTITDDLKFDRMTPIQAATLTDLLPPNRRDCLVEAETGTGKTIAFLLPALQTMITRNRAPDAGISLLVISPARELAMQIAREASGLLQRLPKYCVRVAIGGTNKNREENWILEGCDILIATPGRLFDHMSNKGVIYKFRHLDTIVLDEADRLLDMGFQNSLRDIIRRLPDKKKTGRQGMLFSATVTPRVKQAAGLILEPGYKLISTVPVAQADTHQSVPQLLITVPSFSSIAPAMIGSIREEAALMGEQAFKAIVFAPATALADFYGHILSRLPDLPPVSVLHSRISQNRRTEVTNNYRGAAAAILVATDVAARGMDFPGVTTIFQVGIPADRESYIHRLGRTARAGASGRGVLVVCEAEAWFPRWTLREIAFTPHAVDLSSAARVAEITGEMDDAARAKIYRAWLGYYNLYLKGLRWDKEELVAQGNVYARDGLGAPRTPTIAWTAVAKMRLKGTKGLVIVESNL